MIHLKSCIHFLKFGSMCVLAYGCNLKGSIATKTMKSHGCGIKTFSPFIVNVHRMVNYNLSHFINLFYEPHPRIAQNLTNKFKQKNLYRSAFILTQYTLTIIYFCKLQECKDMWRWAMMVTIDNMRITIGTTTMTY